MEASQMEVARMEENGQPRLRFFKVLVQVVLVRDFGDRFEDVVTDPVTFQTLPEAQEWLEQVPKMVEEQRLQVRQ